MFISVSCFNVHSVINHKPGNKSGNVWAIKLLWQIQQYWHQSKIYLFLWDVGELDLRGVSEAVFLSPHSRLLPGPALGGVVAEWQSEIGCCRRCRCGHRSLRWCWRLYLPVSPLAFKTRIIVEHLLPSWSIPGLISTPLYVVSIFAIFVIVEDTTE